MPPADLARRRLHAQHIAASALERPAEVVASLGAVQAQDYPAALWAIGLRLRRGAEAAVEQAIADRSIVRVWFMRGTLHFVPGADLRWMLALMAPRLRRLVGNTSRYQQLDLDERLFARSQAAIGRALQGGRRLIRRELAAALEQAGIAASGLRLSLILQRAQADGLICYGPRRGKQFAFVLVDEWLPPAPALSRDDALAEFARRYFAGHGPAALPDFMWWSGLPAAEARAGLEAAAPGLARETFAGQTCWSSPAAPAARPRALTAHLLPYYDEFIVGYKDRSAQFEAPPARPADPRDSLIFNPAIVVRGRVVGTWKRALTRSGVLVQLQPFRPLTRAEQRAVAAAARRYGEFLNLPAMVG